MQILQLKLHNLFGSLSLQIDFNADLNLLVGINGSGKTSILNVVDWLLTLNIPRLSATKFDDMLLTYDHMGKQMRLSAVQDDQQLLISLLDNDLFPSPIHVKLIHARKDHLIGRELQAVLASYARLGAEPHEQQIWTYLKALPRPVVISLDRTISVETDEGDFLEFGDKPKDAKRVVAPLTNVQSVTSSRYLMYRNNLIRESDRLKKSMLLSAFRVQAFDFSQGVPTFKLTIDEINALERKVIRHVLGSTTADESEQQIQRFFDGIKKVVNDLLPSQDKEIIHAMFSSQFKQIEDLAVAFTKYELETANAFEGVSKYLQVVNSFFRDTSKHILFDERTNNIGFRFLDGEGAPTGDVKPVEALSSGERQILILLTYIAFVSGDAKIFIVDEPELSLHPKWQGTFLDALLQLRPASTQVLMATHSPEIVGRHKAACKIVGRKFQ